MLKEIIIIMFSYYLSQGGIKSLFRTEILFQFLFDYFFQNNTTAREDWSVRVTQTASLRINVVMANVNVLLGMMNGFVTSNVQVCATAVSWHMTAGVLI